MSTSPALEPPPRLREIIRRAFEAIRADVPEAYGRYCACAPPLIVLTLDGEEIGLGNGADGVVVGAAGDEARLGAGVAGRADGAAVRLRLPVTTLLALVDGGTTLLDALDDGSLVALGSSEAMAATDDAVAAFLQGAVRSPRSAGLLAELRAHAAARDGNGNGNGNGEGDQQHRPQQLRKSGQQA